jgi:hypothetical protein
VEDVFANDDSPPSGWMRAIFDGGPYDADVGRCVPGPPPARRFEAPKRGGSTYYLLSVLSWTDGESNALYVAGRLRFEMARLRRWFDGTGLPYRLRGLRGRL